MQFQDEVLEYRLLGSIISDPSSIFRYSSDIFTGDRVAIFSAMVSAYTRYSEITYEGVSQFLGRPVPQQVEAARGTKAAAVVDRLVELATSRQLVALTNSINTKLASGQLDRDTINKELFLPPIIAKEDSSALVGVTRFLNDLERKTSGRYRFVDTGLPFLNHMLGNEWPRQALTVIIAQSGGGKTALVVNSMLYMARLGIPSLCISLEMPRERLIARMVANISGVDGLRIRAGDITPEERGRVSAAAEELQELNDYLHILDISEQRRTGFSANDIVYQVQAHRERYGIEAYFVDYLQIVRMPDNLVNEVNELGNITYQLRNIGVTLDIAGIALAQQNRGKEGLESIFGSGRIGHIADTVIEIELDKSTTSDDKRMCRLIFHKNRDGPVGESNCFYQPRTLRFY